MDADAWVHPRLVDLPLDAWLGDVPEDRILVLGNRVALNTGVLFLRAGDHPLHALATSQPFESVVLVASTSPSPGGSNAPY